MKGWISSNNRKVHQRKMNKYMKLINKNIEKDELWHGRFVMRQDCAQWFPYEDNSGYNLYVRLKLIDKKTGKIQYIPYKTVNSLCSLNAYKLWEMMNNFIVDYIDVWAKEGRDALAADHTDYSKVTI